MLRSHPVPISAHSVIPLPSIAGTTGSRRRARGSPTRPSRVLTSISPPPRRYYWEPSSGAWQPYTPGDPAVPLVPAPGVDPLHVAALPQQLAVYQVSRQVLEGSSVRVVEGRANRC